MPGGFGDKARIVVRVAVDDVEGLIAPGEKLTLSQCATYFMPAGSEKKPPSNISTGLPPSGVITMPFLVIITRTSFVCQCAGTVNPAGNRPMNA